MSYKITLEEFDNDISSYIERLKNEMKNITFDVEKSIRFVVSNELDCKELFVYNRQKGIYLFELNLDSPNLIGKERATRIKNFAEAWSQKKNDSFFSSSVIKKRLQLRSDYNEQWLPLYIGKNKDIYCRIKEHIDLCPTKNTYAMKLRHRTNLHGLEFRVTTIEIDVLNYDFIVPHIERSLREIYHPLIGKQ
jgi:hypothetical protein